MQSSKAIVAPLTIGSGPFRVAIKDCIDIAGVPTRAGSRAYADAGPATRDASIVRNLRAGQCRLVGKANMHELAFGVTGINDWTGTPLNPLFPDRVPGGSSSGSASAVAGGLVDFAIGSDTGGSIRTPAACCGVFGMKPTFGRIDRTGAYPADSSLDVLGPIARDMQMIEIAMTIIAPGYRSLADLTPRLARVRLPAAMRIDAGVAAAFDQVAAELGDIASDLELPSLEAAFDANIAIIAAETYAAFKHLLPSGLLGHDVEARLAAAAGIDAARLADAENVRRQFREEVDAALAHVDVLVLPTMPCFPPTLVEARAGASALGMTALVRPFNLSGHPALTLPVMTPVGLPIGIQLVGALGADELVCAAGRQIERQISAIGFAGEVQ